MAAGIARQGPQPWDPRRDSSAWGVALQTLNENGFSAEGDGPAGAVRRDRPRGAVASIKPADNVALSVVLDDVAQAKLVGVDLGHGCCPPFLVTSSSGAARSASSRLTNSSDESHRSKTSPLVARSLRPDRGMVSARRPPKDPISDREWPTPLSAPVPHERTSHSHCPDRLSRVTWMSSRVAILYRQAGLWRTKWRPQVGECSHGAHRASGSQRSSGANRRSPARQVTPSKRTSST
jgi:hypothetical protein